MYIIPVTGYIGTLNHSSHKQKITHTHTQVIIVKSRYVTVGDHRLKAKRENGITSEPSQKQKRKNTQEKHDENSPSHVICARRDLQRNFR